MGGASAPPSPASGTQDMSQELSYAEVCRLVGRLFLESQREIDRLAVQAQQSQSLLERLAAERERADRLEAERETLPGGTP